MDIHILHNGEQLGPFTEDAVQAQLKAGRVLISDPAWRPGMGDWIPLAQLLHPAAEVEPATERQKAFLAYMGVEFTPDATREVAARLVDDAMENPRDPARLGRWNEERLHLHPEIFAAEIQARKENRAQHFFDLCQLDGAALFQKVTKAHCQVLVGHLDVHSPNWDADDRTAAAKYFFPALAGKFPQLLTEQGRDKFKSVDHAKGPAHRAPRSSSPSSGKLAAVARGVALGLMILGGLWLGRGAFERKPVSVAPVVSAEPAVATPAPAPPPPQTPPAVEAPAAPAPPPPAAGAEAAPKTEPPATPAPAAEPVKAEPAPNPAMAGDLPTKTDAPNAEPSPGLIAPSPVRNTVTLTKPIQVTLAYGKVTVPAGTPVTILQRNGMTLTVRYLDKTADIPASSTDLGTDPVAVATPAPQPQ